MQDSLDSVHILLILGELRDHISYKQNISNIEEVWIPQILQKLTKYLSNWIKQVSR